MDYMQYSQDFQINSYFNSLPPYARQTILEAYGEITTLGELKKCADHIIDLGPEGGDRGGEIVCTGTPEEVAACPQSYTGQFLKKILEREV